MQPQPELEVAMGVAAESRPQILQEVCVWKEMERGGGEVLVSDAHTAKASFHWNQNVL